MCLFNVRLQLSSYSVGARFVFTIDCSDKTFEGGNDFEIYTSPLTKGHTVTGPADTMQQCKELFMM